MAPLPKHRSPAKHGPRCVDDAGPIEHATEGGSAHPHLYKFPRTPHICDLGAATRDDLVLTADEAAAWLRGGVVLGEVALR